MGIKHLTLAASLVGVAMAAGAANAATCSSGTTPIGTYPAAGTSAFFYVSSGNPLTGPSVTSNFGNGYTSATNFDDCFTFTIPTLDGVGSGSVSTSFSSDLNQLTLTQLIINGMTYNFAEGQTSLSISGIPILAGQLNTIEVIGSTSSAGGTYSGTATFSASVPEAATWGMFILGFGLVGGTMRRRQASTAVTFG